MKSGKGRQNLHHVISLRTPEAPFARELLGHQTTSTIQVPHTSATHSKPKAMAPSTEEADAHQALIDQLDIHSVHKSFRNHHWKPNQRRNKNIKTILGDAV